MILCKHKIKNILVRIFAWPDLLRNAFVLLLMLDCARESEELSKTGRAEREPEPEAERSDAECNVGYVAGVGERESERGLLRSTLDCELRYPKNTNSLQHYSCFINMKQLQFQSADAWT